MKKIKLDVEYSKESLDLARLAILRKNINSPSINIEEWAKKLAEDVCFGEMFTLEGASVTKI